MRCWRRRSCGRWLSESIRLTPLKRRPFETQVNKTAALQTAALQLLQRHIAVVRGAVGRFGMLLDVCAAFETTFTENFGWPFLCLRCSFPARARVRLPPPGNLPPLRLHSRQPLCNSGANSSRCEWRYANRYAARSRGEYCGVGSGAWRDDLGARGRADSRERHCAGICAQVRTALEAQDFRWCRRARKRESVV